VALAARYKGLELDEAYRLDLVVEGLVVVEIKAVQKLAPIHAVQVLTYLRFLGKRLGLLLNFHAPSMREGIRRVVNKL
jgi:GxxExxY protein